MGSRLGHDAYYLELLKLLAARGTCPRRQVAAVLVDERYRVLSTGYNGVPPGFEHCVDVPCPGAGDASGDTRRCYAVHAEVNAVLQCSRLEAARTLYVSCTPCFACAKMLACTSIRRIVCREPYSDLDGLRVLELAGISCEVG